MSFITDKQTLDDLNILGKYKPNSLFSFFNRVHTPGGEKLLQAMFEKPLTDNAEINARSSAFRYFQDKAIGFPFDSIQLSVMESYLYDADADGLLVTGITTVKKWLQSILLKDEEYEKVRAGIKATVATLHYCREFVRNVGDHPYQQQIKAMSALLEHPLLKELKQDVTGLKMNEIIRLEYLFRTRLKTQLSNLIDIICHLDVYIAVGELAAAERFCYVNMLPGDKNIAGAKNLRYPGLKRAVGNDVQLDEHNNVIFLTGANMAGKSTLMKTFGIAVYLAHMGFPVAAEEMTLSVKDGIYSSINVPDNLSMGLSHFYAEVLRVKKVAEDVAAGKNLVVIFDELFKGTNVKDAYDATLAVTTAFSEYENCLFIISTHIIEVGEALSVVEPIQFLYLPTVLEGTVPRYTYRLQQGITADRQGMIIIENEGILDMN
jgi:DNA mismatch repair protein MutS